MASITAYRHTYSRWLKQYERQAYKLLQSTFDKWGRNIPFAIMSESNYSDVLNNVISDDPMIRTYETMYTEIGLVHGKRTGRQINRELKFFKPGDFESVFLNNIGDFLRSFGGERIESVEKTYVEYIKTLLSTRLQEGKTIFEAAKEIQELVRKPNFYRWQALRIARTESTTAANYAATKANDVTDFVMEKIWISALDSRTRRTPPDKYDHQDLNGKKVDPDEPFTTSRGEKLMYPGDPSGSAGNIINCRCSVAYRAKRDKDGNLIDK